MNLIKNEHGYYEARIKDKYGRTHSLSTHEKNKDEAKRKLKAAQISKIEKAAEVGVLSQEAMSIVLTGRKATVQNSVKPFEAWLKMQNQSPRSIESALGWINSWAHEAGKLYAPIVSIKAEDINKWINDPKSPRKASTRSVMLASLRSFFKFLSAQGWILGNPASLVKVDYLYLSHDQKEREEKPAFTDEEVNTLLDATAPLGDYPSPFWHFAIAASRCYGLRLGDICGMEWAAVNESNGEICVWTEKRDKRVTPALMEPASRIGCWMAALKSVERDSARYLFPKQHYIHTDVKARSGLSVQFSRLCEKVGIEGKSFHCLRASYCTACDMANVPVEHIARNVGHSNTDTTMGYIRPYA